MSQDPAAAGTNWYAYCGNDPVNATDPSGLKLSKTDQWWYMYTDSSYDRGAYHWDDHDNLHYNDFDGTHVTLSQGVDLPGGGNSGPSLGQDIAAGFGVGLSAVGSAASFHQWDGGAAKHDPSFGVSRGLADVGVAAGASALGAVGAAGRVAGEGETIVTHWNTERELANIARNGLKEGSWVMKGKPNVLKWIATGRFLNYRYNSRVILSLPDHTVTQQQVDLLQKALGHFRYWPGVF